MTLMEEWRDVPNYEGVYQVSDQGRARSVDRIIICADGRKARYKGRTLCQHLDKHGYYCVGFWMGGIFKNIIVHNAVLRTFGGDAPSPEHMACHRDGNRTNNVPSNLLWGTNSENQLARRHQGTSVEGEKNHKARLTVAQAHLIRSLKGEFILRELGDIFDVSLHTIWSIQNGRNWVFALEGRT